MRTRRVLDCFVVILFSKLDIYYSIKIEFEMC